MGRRSEAPGVEESEREALLKRVKRQGATIGASTPETITVDGEELDLAEFVIETRRVEGVPPDAEETLAAVKRTLREERVRRLERLESDDLDRETAETLADEIVGIDRALNALMNLRGPRYGEAAGSETIRDYERWLGFLEDVTG